MTLFRSARKISRYLVRAKLCLLDRSFGSFKCGARRWQVCSNVTETEKHLLVLLLIRPIKTIINLIVVKVPLFIYWCVRSVLSSILDKRMIYFAVDGIIVGLMTECI